MCGDMDRDSQKRKTPPRLLAGSFPNSSATLRCTVPHRTGKRSNRYQYIWDTATLAPSGAKIVECQNTSFHEQRHIPEDHRDQKESRVLKNLSNNNHTLSRSELNCEWKLTPFCNKTRGTVDLGLVSDNGRNGRAHLTVHVTSDPHLLEWCLYAWKAHAGWNVL